MVILVFRLTLTGSQIDHERIKRSLPYLPSPQHNTTQSVFALNTHQVTWRSPARMPRSLTRGQYQQLLEVTGMAGTVLTKANLTWCMGGVTLLGSYMMHDVLPWDDTGVSFLLPSWQKPQLKQALEQSKLSGKYKIVRVSSAPQPKLKSQNSVIFTKLRLQIPSQSNQVKRVASMQTDDMYVDFCFYDVNHTHVHMMNSQRNFITLKKELFYPTHGRPFANMWLHSPRKPRDVLLALFGGFSCDATYRKNRHTPVVCANLAKYYPVVWRQKAENVTMEILGWRGRKLRSRVVQEPFPEISKPLIL